MALNDHNIYRATDFNQNRLLRPSFELLSALPGSPQMGQFGMLDDTFSTTTLRRRVSFYDQGTLGAPEITWAILGSINRQETLTQLWTFNPPVILDGTPAYSRAPFAVGANVSGASTNRRASVVAFLNSDLLDGYDSSVPVVADTVPIRKPQFGADTRTVGRVEVGWPVDDYDATPKIYVSSMTGGLNPVTGGPARCATVGTFPGAYATNVITATGNGAASTYTSTFDGVLLVAGDRVLFKNQSVAPNTPLESSASAFNGIYAVTDAGSSTTKMVFTRTVDCDQPSEITVGAYVVVTEGVKCGGVKFRQGLVVNIVGTDPNQWNVFDTANTLRGGRGIVTANNEIHFARDLDYGWIDGGTTRFGEVAISSATRKMTLIAGVGSSAATANAFFLKWDKDGLPEAGAPPGVPKFATIGWTDVVGKPVVPIFTGSNPFYARFSATAGTIENAYLKDVFENPSSRVLPADASVTLGNTLNPFAQVFTQILTTSAQTNATLFGVAGFAADPGTTKRDLLVFDSVKVKNWLAFSATDLAEKIALNDLTDVTLGTRSDGQALVYSTSQALWVNDWYQWVNLTGRPTGSLNRLAKFTSSGAPALYGDSNTVDNGTGLYPSSDQGLTLGGASNSWGDFWITLSLKDANPISFVLGKTASSLTRVKQFTSAEVKSWLAIVPGDVALTTNAVGYGVAGALSGDPTKLYFDGSRLGVQVASPGATLDLLGNVKILHQFITGSGNPPYTGINLQVDDSSTSTADWTSRTLTGFTALASKSGSATFSVSAVIHGNYGRAEVLAGSASTTIAVRGDLRVGNTSGTPTTGVAYNFYAGSYAAPGTSGSIGTRVAYYVEDYGAVSAPITNHYGVQVSNLTAGTTVNRALHLFVAKTGAGTRHNIYAGGDADNYFFGNLGLGVSAPTARLEFSAGTATLASLRFAAASNVLLTTPVAGTVEVDLTSTNKLGRPWFTDGTPTRRGLAFYDDLNLSNDPGADGGAINFSSATTGLMFAVSRLDGVVLSGDFSVMIRFRVPLTTAATNYGVWSLSQGAGGNALGYDWGAFFTGSSGMLQILIRDAAGSISRTWTQDISKWRGRVIDLVVVRKTNVVSIYLDGQPSTPTPSGPVQEDQPVAGGGAILRFNVGGIHTASPPLGERVYAARVYNRALSAADILSLGRYGVDETDKWGSDTPVLQANWTSTVDGWTASQGTMTPGQSIGGKSNVLSFLPNAVSGGHLITKPSVPINKYGYCEVEVYTPSGNLVVKAAGFVLGGGATPKSFAEVPNTWTKVTGAGLVTVDSLMRIFAWPTGGFGAYVGNGSDIAYFNAAKAWQTGCLVDLDLGIGFGSVLPDRSNRYPAQLNGSFDHVIARASTVTIPVDPSEADPLDPTTGDGTISANVHRFVQRRSFADSTSKVITHGLGVDEKCEVALWDVTSSPKTKVECGVQTIDANSLTITVGLLGGTKTLTVVVIG